MRKQCVPGSFFSDTIAARFANTFFLKNFCERIFAHVYVRDSSRSQESAIFLLSLKGAAYITLREEFLVSIMSRKRKLDLLPSFDEMYNAGPPEAICGWSGPA